MYNIQLHEMTLFNYDTHTYTHTHTKKNTLDIYLSYTLRVGYGSPTRVITDMFYNLTDLVG